MDLYSRQSTGPLTRFVLLAVIAAAVAVSFIILFVVNPGFHPGMADAASFSALVLFAFNVLNLIRFSATLFVFLKRRIPAAEVASVSIAFILYLIGFPVFSLFPHWHSVAVTVAGGVLFLTGGALNSWSEFQRFRFKRDPRHRGRLFTGGLFSLTRHPNYFGDCLWVLGYALAAASGWALLIPLLLVSFFAFYNIPLLERHLESKYGDEFREYRKKVKSLIPFLF